MFYGGFTDNENIDNKMFGATAMHWMYGKKNIINENSARNFIEISIYYAGILCFLHDAICLAYILLWPEMVFNLWPFI